jgi:hypothetical protein
MINCLRVSVCWPGTLFRIRSTTHIMDISLSVLSSSRRVIIQQQDSTSAIFGTQNNSTRLSRSGMQSMALIPQAGRADRSGTLRLSCSVSVAKAVAPLSSY